MVETKNLENMAKAAEAVEAQLSQLAESETRLKQAQARVQDELETLSGLSLVNPEKAHGKLDREQSEKLREREGIAHNLSLIPGTRAKLESRRQEIIGGITAESQRALAAAHEAASDRFAEELRQTTDFLKPLLGHDLTKLYAAMQETPKHFDSRVWMEHFSSFSHDTTSHAHRARKVAAEITRFQKGDHFSKAY